MTGLLWFLSGGSILGTVIGLAMHWLLSSSVYQRGIAEGRRQVLQRDSYPSVAAPRPRRSPNHQLVTRQFEQPLPRPVLDDRLN